MPALRLLIVEDNADIVANLNAFLEPRGYILECAANGYGALALAAQNPYDAVVLDIALPGMNGLEVCRKLRGELHLSIPVLMLTARDTVEDKVLGFESGADDYLVKPFSLVELEIRLKALVRRAQGRSVAAPALTSGDLVLNSQTYEAARAGRPLALTKTAFRILEVLLLHAPNVVAKEVLEHELWGEDRPESDALRTHIHSLRQVLDKPFSFAMLKTVQGVGYRLVEYDATNEAPSVASDESNNQSHNAGSANDGSANLA